MEGAFNVIKYSNSNISEYFIVCQLSSKYLIHINFFNLFKYL